MNAPAGNTLVIWAMIAAIAGITFALRYLPLRLLSRIHLPLIVKRALVFVPAAVMAAIITPALFFPGGTPTISLDTPRLLAALIAGGIAWKTRNVFLTIVLGMCALWGLQSLLN